MDEKMQQVLNFLVSKSGGLPPTVREICAATGIRSTSTVHSVLRRLQNAGLIDKTGQNARALRVSGAENPVLIPLYAGIDAFCSQTVQRYLPISKSGGQFAVIVPNGLKNAAILPGDTVFFTADGPPADGEPVLARCETQVVFRRYYQEPFGVRLQSDDEFVLPIYTAQATVLGRATAIFRAL